MTRSPLALAALATVAVPGLDAHSVRVSEVAGDYDVAVVTDIHGAPGDVRAPRTIMAGASALAEDALLRALHQYQEVGVLPFAVPEMAGSAPLPEGGRATVHRHIAGTSLDVDSLRPGPGLAADLGRTIAAIHELPATVVEGAGLPVYPAAEYRRRRLVELEEAAATCRIPSALLSRWEMALQDASLWGFQPVVLHGDLAADQVLVSGGRVTAITGWSSARVADPADDLAWLLVAAPAAAIDTITEAYSARRTDLKDPRLVDRALLAGEFALARWLLHGVRENLPDVIEDAVAMLADLDDATREAA
ncbi:MAG: phosphotransferase [Promicromonosporaceae bacterium]|nr:phosphotransferase [Promicromonosporaceae bacterium]